MAHRSSGPGFTGGRGLISQIGVVSLGALLPLWAFTAMAQSSGPSSPYASANAPAPRPAPTPAPTPVYAPAHTPLTAPAARATAGAPSPSITSLPGGTRAQLVAVRRAVISSELAAKIASIPLREGQSFRMGDTLVAYDCGLNRARLERATQAEAAARQKQQVAEELDKLGAISRSDVVQARAAVLVAQADSGVERVMVKRCTISAPFAGRVGDTFVRASEHVAEGKELLSIYDDSAFEVETIVPSRWMAWLKPGYPMRISVDETGQTYAASVARIAGVVDPVSQSVKIVGRLVNDRGVKGGAPLLPGMSGEVRIDPPAAGTPGKS